MGLNLSSDQIAKELDLDPSETLAMTTTLRHGIVARRPEPALSGEVECDEAYVVAGQKGNPEAVKKKASRAPAAAEGGAWPGHAGQGEAADPGDVAAGR